MAVLLQARLRAALLPGVLLLAALPLAAHLRVPHLALAVLILLAAAVT